MNLAVDILQQIETCGLCRPRKLTFSITTNCNLRCEHCWVECDWTERTGVSAPTKEVLRIIKEFADLGGETLNLTGGEPFSHPDFREILDFCLHSELTSVVVQTNATLLNRYTLKPLPEASTSKLSFQVSLDGASAEVHEQVRDKGSFENALSGLTVLVKEGYGPRTTIGFTEMHHNMHEIPDLLKLVADMGLGSVTGWSLVDFGKAKDTERLISPSPEQYVKLLELYQENDDFRALYEKHGNFAAIEWFKGRNHPTGHSCVFIEKPYLSAAGLLYPCVLLQEDDYAADDLFNRSLVEAIMGKLEVWANLRRSSVKHNEELKCLKICPGAGHCAGGCFGRTRPTEDSSRGREDRCDLRRAVYCWDKSQ